jgi:predicted acetyltransferase
VNGNLAGFALVNSHCKDISSSGVYSIAEFFVMLKYRRKCIGRYVAKKVLDMHRGQWEVLQMSKNVRAQKFWKSVISEYTCGAYKEIGYTDDEMIGFLFDSSHLSFVSKENIF